MQLLFILLRICNASEIRQTPAPTSSCDPLGMRGAGDIPPSNPFLIPSIAQPRIQRIAQAISQQIEGQHG